MKGTTLSQESRVPSGLRFTATKRHDEEANLLARRNVIVINSLPTAKLSVSLLRLWGRPNMTG
jgi:hypothetical protein